MCLPANACRSHPLFPSGAGGYKYVIHELMNTAHELYVQGHKFKKKSFKALPQY